MKDKVKKVVTLTAKAASAPHSWMYLFEPQKPRALCKDRKDKNK